MILAYLLLFITFSTTKISNHIGSPRDVSTQLVICYLVSITKIWNNNGDRSITFAKHVCGHETSLSTSRRMFMNPTTKRGQDTWYTAQVIVYTPWAGKCVN